MIDFISHRCPSSLYKGAKCRLCVESCIEGCIKFKDNSISINQEACTLCGICTAACPSSALNLRGFSDRTLWERLKAIVKGKEHVVLTCSSAKELKGNVRLREGSCLIGLSCVGMLKDVHLIGLFLSGVKEIWLRSSCKYCTSVNGRRVLLQSVEYARNLLQSLNLEDKIVISEDLPVEDIGKMAKAEVITPVPHYSRRKFLTTLRDKIDILHQVTLVENEEHTRPSEPDLPERRQILIELLEGIDGQIKHVLKKGCFPAYQIRVNHNCTLCHTCDLFCPTGAIERVEDKEGVRIDFRLSNCVGCFQCEELCPEKALYSSNTMDLESFLNRKKRTLYQKKMVLCSECESPHLPIDGMNTCLSCRKKKDMEKGFFAMMDIED